MKKLLLYMGLTLAFPAFSQENSEPIQNLDVMNESAYFKAEDGVVAAKYYVTGSFDWKNPNYEINATLDIAQTDANGHDVILKSLHITNNPELFSSFNLMDSGFL